MNLSPSPLSGVIARLLTLPAAVMARCALRAGPCTDGTCTDGVGATAIADEPLDPISPYGPPVFISGCSRGGTSILAHLLSHHPDLHSVGRGPYHEARWVWEKRFHDGSHHRWAIDPWLRTMRKTAADATPELLAFFRETYAAACGEMRMLEKTPSNAVRLPFIDRLYPDCYIVHILRDGRDTAASLMARRVKLPYAARQWVGVHTIALGDIERLGPARATVVRYEDLLRTPVETLLELCRHCRLDTGAHARDVLSAAVASHLKQPCDRWSALGPGERRRVLSIIGDMQARLGYPVEE